MAPATHTSRNAFIRAPTNERCMQTPFGIDFNLNARVSGPNAGFFDILFAYVFSSGWWLDQPNRFSVSPVPKVSTEASNPERVAQREHEMNPRTGKQRSVMMADPGPRLSKAALLPGDRAHAHAGAERRERKSAGKRSTTAHASPSREMRRLHFKFKVGAQTNFSLLRGPPTPLTSMEAKRREAARSSRRRRLH